MSQVITEEEKVVLEKLGSAWNDFVKLPASHPDDLKEMRRAIHSAQLIIAGRIAKRVDPDIWT